MEREPKQIILKLDLTVCGSDLKNTKSKWHQEDVQAILRIYCWWIHHDQKRQSEAESTLLKDKKTFSFNTDLVRPCSKK